MHQVCCKSQDATRYNCLPACRGDVLSPPFSFALFGPVLLFLPAAKPAGLWLANVTLLLLDTWLLGALDAFRCMLAQVGELARIKYDVS